MTYQEKLRDLIRAALKVARSLPTATVKDERRDIIAALTQAMKELALPADFGWGPVIEVHHIGTHEVIEYEDVPSGVDGQHSFYVKSVGHFNTLDEAILASIAAKYSDVEDLDYMLRILKKERLE